MDADISTLYQSGFYHVLNFKCRCTDCITSKPEYVDTFSISFVSFNRFFREDILDAYYFNDIYQMREKVWEWTEDYNNNHPHSSLGNKSPREFKARFSEEI